jgi:hypothetical protein
LGRRRPLSATKGKAIRTIEGLASERVVDGMFLGGIGLQIKEQGAEAVNVTPTIPTGRDSHRPEALGIGSILSLCPYRS